ncbi:FixH family protein [Numidum massiliense]|uniref:FixH family protein n=1 Tax=Numidum massiliense TaxID=1522315 RepID=UPI0006D536ED|nr:FixH family protein [Numidum massiliense]
MKKIVALFAVCLLVATGCAAGTDDQAGSADDHASDAHADTGQDDSTPTALDPIEVAIDLPEKVAKGKATTIKATVTQAEEKVTDADEVLFEVWRDGEDKHDKIEGKHTGDGVYAIDKTFEEKGTYYVIAHVTARGMHNMPKQPFTVE